jgi:O-antigen ligase
MSQKLAIRTLAQIIYLGAPLVSLLVVTGVVTDPVNSTKLTALVTLSFPILALFLTRLRKQFLSENLGLSIVAGLFVLAALISVSNSDSPISQNIYGVYGRSTGFLAYFSLVLFMLGAASINEIKYHSYLVRGFLVTGLINMIYCAWVLVFGDFIGWSNPYGEILGLFGNPNFIGAFLGMFLVGTLSILLQQNTQYQWRFFGLIVVSITFFEIVKSRAIQGLVVSVGGVALVGLLYLWAKRVKTVFVSLYVLVILALSIFSIFGALQRGPFDFIYKRSVSLRGTYWESGFQMGIQNPFSGVGMDAYGDWYRRVRPPRALIDTPGIETVTNAAHNVFLDIFAYGGFPLLLSYLGILGFGLRAVIKFMSRRNPYDGIFATLAVVWICYQVQSLISINQIGLAVWGWALTGALVSYEKSTRVSGSLEPDKVLRKQGKWRAQVHSQENVSSGLIAGVGLMVGMIVALPPVTADNKWRSALLARNLEKIESSLIPGYFNPSNSQKYAQAINLLQNNNLPDLALKYSRASVKFNPEDFTAWFQLYSLDNSSPEEKATALANLKRLDPLNPDVTKP